MKYIELGNNEKPCWWGKFIEYAFSLDADQHRVIETKEWSTRVNAALMTFGGAMHRDYKRRLFYITFRQDINYTMFLLRFS